MTKNLKNFKKEIFKLTEGLIEKVVDFVLILAILQYEFAPFRGSMFHVSDRVIEKSGTINYRSIKETLLRARKNGWLKFNLRRKNKIRPEITQAGLKRLSSTLPIYDEKRKWDRKIYFITYDIPEKEKEKRDAIRRYLKMLGCAMLQASVWLTPYDPRGVIYDFIKENHLKDNVIISIIGKGGMIGEENIRILLRKIYSLDKLNKRYCEYIENFKNQNLTLFEGYIKFLSILSDDPQIPFLLLSHDWLGEKAYRLFKKRFSKFRIV